MAEAPILVKLSDYLQSKLPNAREPRSRTSFKQPAAGRTKYTCSMHIGLKTEVQSSADFVCARIQESGCCANYLI